MLASFLRLDPDLVYIASQASRPVEPAVSRQSIEAWVRGLADSERTSLLVRLVADEAPDLLRAELIQRFSQAIESPAQPAPRGTGTRRSVGDLLAAAAQRTEARERAAAEKAERERQQLARAQAAARARYLDGLVGHLDELWQQVDALVTTKRQSDYDAAVKLIQDLHDVADRHGQLDPFAARLQQFRAGHAKKVTLLERLGSAQLL